MKYKIKWTKHSGDIYYTIGGTSVDDWWDRGYAIDIEQAMVYDDIRVFAIWQMAFIGGNLEMVAVDMSGELDELVNL